MIRRRVALVRCQENQIEEATLDAFARPIHDEVARFCENLKIHFRVVGDDQQLVSVHAWGWQNGRCGGQNAERRTDV